LWDNTLSPTNNSGEKDANTIKEVELRVDNSLMRTYVAAPAVAGKYPGILLYS